MLRSRIFLAAAFVAILASPAAAPAFPIRSAIGRAVFHSNYDALTRRLFTAMSAVPPSPARKAILAAAETCIESHGLLAVFGWINVYNGEDASQNVVNLADPSKKLTVVSTGSFSSLGWTGSGGYLAYPEPLNGDGKFTLNAATIGVWWNGTGVNGANLMGTSPTSNNQLAYTNGSSLNGRLGNATTGSPVTFANEHDLSAVRTDNTTLTFYATSSIVVGSVSSKGVSSSATVSDASVSANFGSVGAGRGTTTTMTLAASWSGGAATATNLTDLHNCLLPVLSSTGAQ